MEAMLITDNQNKIEIERNSKGFNYTLKVSAIDVFDLEAKLTQVAEIALKQIQKIKALEGGING